MKSKITLELPENLIVHIVKASSIYEYYYYWYVKLENCELMSKKSYKSRKSAERNWVLFCKKHGIDKKYRFKEDI